ncbi:lysophospholipid acyltransferase family protein [Clostridium omnivorum]|uniref:1-acyl-sn-glycerol-3-phosphate acyltransferase n=1 Tax=Clostridium omnivorum TaxID=1604902 RepID=A0ABQ5N216_9CLOT|nr:lysophospholipid acyltransferase family protein [Clostridium sp. E14]GLC29224.1 1-acyl-sn-glycerol-3-phosphate acyltransferase [Clostridium sp. E14]
MISPKMAKLISYMPDSFVKYMSKAVLNHIIKKYADINIYGGENLKSIKGPVIFICNHLSNSDALILNKVLEAQDVTFVAGVKLSENATTNLGINIIKTTPVRPNTADKEGIEKIIKIVKGGGNILLFPEGTRSRTGSMIQAKKGILLIAKVTKVPIVPIGIWGTEKLLPIAKDGDMASEKFSYSKIGVSIGDAMEIPKRLQGEDKVQYETRALNTMMKEIAKLIPEEYKGEYKD